MEKENKKSKEEAPVQQPAAPQMSNQQAFNIVKNICDETKLSKNDRTAVDTALVVIATSLQKN